MKATRLYTLLALLLMMGGVTMHAQELEPEEFFSSPTVLAYHICEWDDYFFLINAIEFGEGRNVMLIDQNGDLAASEVWYENTNTCSNTASIIRQSVSTDLITSILPSIPKPT